MSPVLELILKPYKTAQRLLCAFPSEHRQKLAHALFRDYWTNSGNINLRTTLLRLARALKLTSVAAPTHAGPFSLEPNLPFTLDESVFSDTKWADQLRENTLEAFERGAFGVPSFWVEDTKKLYWGQVSRSIGASFVPSLTLVFLTGSYAPL